MKKSLLFILCICFILAVGCTKSINQEVPSLASSYVNIESQLSSGVKSSEINSGSESTISNVNPSVIELLNNCGHVQSLIDIKMNSFIPNYTGFSDLYSLSPLKEYKSKQSFSTISTQEGGTFYLYFVYDDDIKLNCQTHFFYMNGSISINDLQSVKTGDNLHDCLKRIDKENSSIYEERALINDYNNAVLIWTNDGLYAIEYEHKNEIYVVNGVKKCSDNEFSNGGYTFKLFFE